MLKNGFLGPISIIFILPVLLLAFWALTARLAAAAPGANTGADRQVKEAGRIMVQAQTAAGRDHGKPPLDLTVPAKIETATFALG